MQPLVKTCLQCIPKIRHAHHSLIFIHIVSNSVQEFDAVDGRFLTARLLRPYIVHCCPQLTLGFIHIIGFYRAYEFIYL